MTGVRVFSDGVPASPRVPGSDGRRLRNGTTGGGRGRSAPDAGMLDASGMKKNRNKLPRFNIVANLFLDAGLTCSRTAFELRFSLENFDWSKSRKAGLSAAKL